MCLYVYNNVLCVCVCDCYRSGDGESFIVGPLTTDNDVSITRQQQQQQLPDDNTTKQTAEQEQPSGPFVYRFQLWARLLLDVTVCDI